MNWLARLKKLEITPAPTLQNLQKKGAGAFVGFVGSCPEPFQNLKPESEVITAIENDAFTARLALFPDRGLSLADAQAMTERLALRDLEQDERRLCLECRHLSGGTDSRRCSQWRKIGQINGAAIPGELVTILQRCAGFNNRLEVMV